MSSLIVAIDGPSASGKGTLAALLAEKYGFDCLDTGTFFRALALRVIKQGLTEKDIALCIEQAGHVTQEDLESPDLKTETIAQMASKLSANPAIRTRFHRFCWASVAKKLKKYPGVVVDGRDVGTALFPEAPVKLYLVVRPEERAKRRFKELQEKDPDVCYESVLKSVMERDARDQNRLSDPLKPALDAHILDVSDLTKQEVLALASTYVDAALEEKRG